MNGAFGHGDWLANGILFAGYHLHKPWVMPATLLDAFILAYPTKRYRSAWIGIAVHSAQSVFVILAVDRDPERLHRPCARRLRKHRHRDQARGMAGLGRGLPV